MPKQLVIRQSDSRALRKALAKFPTKTVRDLMRSCARHTKDLQKRMIKGLPGQ